MLWSSWAKLGWDVLLCLLLGLSLVTGPAFWLRHAQAAGDCCKAVASGPSISGGTFTCDAACLEGTACRYKQATYTYSMASGCFSCESISLPDEAITCGSSAQTQKIFAVEVECDPGCDCMTEGQLLSATGSNACDNSTCSSCPH